MFFSKKKKEVEPSEGNEEEASENSSNQDQERSQNSVASLGQLTADVEKLKAQFSTFYEMQKASTERFSMINEQIGELRSMLIERDKDSKYIEAKATQAIDLVKTVQPDKLMIELRKCDSKIEALRANLESNEMVINNVIGELKEMRNKMMTFTGIEQVVKLNEEVKGELMEIRKINATIERHADKVETIFTEMQKRFREFERYSSMTNDMDKSFKQMGSEFDSVKIKIADLSSKKEMEGLITKFDEFEKHTGSIIGLLNKKFDDLRKETGDKFDEKFEKTNKLLRGFEELAQKTPDLDKYFHLLEEEAKKAPEKELKVEKIKVPGEEPSQPSPQAEKKSIFGIIKDKIKS